MEQRDTSSQFQDSFLLDKSHQKTNYTKHSLANKGIEVWNTLTKDLKQIKLHFVFKQEAKTTFFILNLLRIPFVYRRNFKVPKTKKLQEFYFPKIQKTAGIVLG